MLQYSSLPCSLLINVLNKILYLHGDAVPIRQRSKGEHWLLCSAEINADGYRRLINSQLTVHSLVDNAHRSHHIGHTMYYGSAHACDTCCAASEAVLCNLEDSIFILKIQDSILSCIFKILLKSIIDKEEDTFWRYTFHKILFVVHYVR